MRKKIQTLLVLTFLSATVLAALRIGTMNDMPTQNGFSRKVVMELSQLQTMDLPNDKLYFAGSVSDRSYLGNPYNPVEMFIAHDNEEPLEMIRLGYHDTIHAARYLIDSPYFYLPDYHDQKVRKGLISDWQVVETFRTRANFSDLAVVNSSVILRSIINNEFELVKESKIKPIERVNPDALQRQIDGLFCVDGMLQYSKSLSRLVYTYFYRNEFIVMDTNLNVMSRRKTIDTTTHAKINVSRIKSKGTLTMSSPPLLVNRLGILSDSILYVNSKLAGDNEDRPVFNSSSAIDTYSVIDGSYLGSFYIPPYKGVKMTHFTVNKQILRSLHGKYLVTYRIDRMKPIHPR